MRPAASYIEMYPKYLRDLEKFDQLLEQPLAKTN